MRTDLLDRYPHPGKYEGEINLTEVLDKLDADEDVGSVDEGGNFRLYLNLADEDVDGSITKEYHNAILRTDSQGFVHGEYFDSPEEAENRWAEYTDEDFEDADLDDWDEDDDEWDTESQYNDSATDDDY